MIDSSKMILIDNQCPSRPNSLLLDQELSDFFFQLYPTTPISKVAFADGYNQLYEVLENDFGQAKFQQIEINQNRMLISAFAIAGIIALLGGVFSIQLAYLLVKSLKIKYNKFLLNQKQLAITLKQQKLSREEEALNNQQLLQEFQGHQKIFEQRGLFETGFQENENLIKQKNLTFSFSLFQIPALVLDYYLRTNLNSLNQFLLSISQSKIQFSSKKMKQYDKTDVSYPLFKFQQLYSNFCSKNGYVEIPNIAEDGKDVLKSFGLSIENFEGKQVPAYVNVRFKTNKEKAETKYDESIEKESLIKQFLNQECLYSQFETDYISFDEINLVYSQYCKNWGIQESKKEQIIGSDEMIKFGASIKPMNPPKRIVGVKKGKPDKITQEMDSFGLIRRPSDLKNTIISKFISVDGIVPNGILAILHFLLILIVPIISPIISFLALCEMTTFQGNVYARQVTFFDFYTTNRLDPWWNNTPYLKEVGYFHIYVIFYLFFAYTELISFYLTGYDNNGKFNVRYTFTKRFFMLGFYSAIGILCFLYVSMLWFALVWAVLAAIFNPSVFLPYTAAALTLIGTFTAKYVHFKTKYQTIRKDLENVIKEKLGQAFQKSLEKIKANLGDSKLGGYIDKAIPSDPNQQKAILEKGFQSVFSEEQDGKKKSFTEVMKSGMPGVVKIIANQMEGLDPVIIELIVAVSTQDKDQINEAVKKLASNLKMDGELLQAVMNLASLDLNSKNKSKNAGAIEHAIKNLFRVLTPDLPLLDHIGDISKFLFEKDPNSIIKYLELLFPDKSLREPVMQIFRILTFAQSGMKSKLKKELMKFLQTNLQSKELENQFKTYKLLCDLREADVTSLLEEASQLSGESKLAKLLGLKQSYPILCLIDIFTNSSTLSNQVLLSSIREMLNEGQMISEEERIQIVKKNQTSDEIVSTIEKFFLAMIYLAKGDQVDVKSIGKAVNRKFLNMPPVDVNKIVLINEISQNSQSSFEQVLFKLDCSQQREILVEFYNLLQQKRLKFQKFCGKLCVIEKIYDNFTELIYLLYHIMSYELLMQDFDESNPAHSKELSQLRQDVLYCLLNLQDSSGQPLPVLSFEFTEEINESIKNDLSGQDSILQEASSIRSEVTQEDEGIFEIKVKSLLKKVLPKQIIKKEALHFKLWKQTLRSIDVEDQITDQTLSFFKDIAIILLKVNGKVPQAEKQYIKAVSEISELIDVEFDVLDFLIDAIQGNPLHIFKVKNESMLQYDLKDSKQQSSCSFDFSRSLLLQRLLNGTERQLSQICLNWYHQYHYYSEAKSTVQAYFMKGFNISTTFIEILQMKIKISEEKSIDQHKKNEFAQLCEQYLREKIREVRLQSNKVKQLDQYPVTDRFFGDEQQCPNKIEKNIPLDDIQLQQIADVLEKLISLSSLERPQLMKITGITDKKSSEIKALNSILRSIKNQGNGVYLLEMLKTLSKVASSKNEEAGLSIANLFNGDSQLISKTHFISLSMILNAQIFQHIFNFEDQQFHKLIQTTNKILEIEDEQYAHLEEEKDYRALLQALHDNDFLSSAEEILMAPLSEKLSSQKAQSLCGFMMGSAIQNHKLIRVSLTEIIKDSSIDPKVLEGIVSVLLGDIETQDSIINLASQLEIDGQLLINLMDVTQKNTQNFTEIIIDLLKTNWSKEDIKICSSFISLYKGDLSQSKILFSKLGVQSEQALPFISAALGNFTVLSEFYTKIQEFIELNNTDTVIYLLQLSHGDSSCIYNLASKKDPTFYIYEPELVNSIFQVTYFGTKFSENEMIPVPCTMDQKLSCIAQKLAKTFGLINNVQIQKLIKAVNLISYSVWKSKDELNSLVKKLHKNTQSSSPWYTNGGKKQSQLSMTLNDSDLITFLSDCFKAVLSHQLQRLNHLKSTQSQLINSLQHLILPSFKLFDALDSKNQEHPSSQPPPEEEIKEQIPDQEENEHIEEHDLEEERELLMDQKQQEENGRSSLKRRFQEGLKKKISENEGIKQALKRFQEINSKGEEGKKFEEIITSLQDPKMKSSFIIGCTYGIGLEMRIDQPIYSCQTCNESIGNETLAICYSCSIFCHAGHKVTRLSSNQFIKHICDCGNGRMNKCTELNNQNPVQNLRQKKTCSVFQPTIKLLQQESFEQIDGNTKIFKGKTKISEIQNYDTQQFLIDLKQALTLPTYFEGLPELQQELNKHGCIKEDQGIMLFSDSLTGQKNCLSSNLILMASGNASNSFLSILGVKKIYSKQDYVNQDPFMPKDPNQSNFRIYSALQAFNKIAQNDLEGFSSHSNGLATVMDETGTRENQAVDKLYQVILLAKGGQMPKIDIQNELSKFDSKYVQLFKNQFGENWNSMIALHKALTLSRPQLIEAFYTSSQENSNSDEMNTLNYWFDLVLFETSLGLKETSISYCKSIVCLLQSHAPSFDFLAEERDIPVAQSIIYKSLAISRKPNQILQVLQKLVKNQQLPNDWLARKLVKLLVEKDDSELINFIIRYLTVIVRDKGDWSAKGVKVTAEETDEVKAQRKYLKELYSLMSGDVNDYEKLIDSVLSKCLSNSLVQEKVKPLNPKLMNLFLTVFGVLNQDQDFISRFASIPAFKEFTPELMNTLISLVKGSPSSKELRQIVKALSGIDLSQTAKDSDQSILEELCKDLLQALQGDLVLLTKIIDKLGNNGSYFRSLLASLMTGQTQYDQIKDPKKAKLGKNLLVREVFKVFEKGIKIQYASMPNDQSEKFLEETFKKRAPLYFIILLTEDKTLMESLFNIQEQYLTNLNTDGGKITLKDKKFVKIFYNFLNPFNTEVSIKPLLKYLLKIEKKNREISLPMLPDLLNPDSDNSGQVSIDVLDFFELAQNCISSDNMMQSTKELFDNLILTKLLPKDDQPSLVQQCITLQQSLTQQGDKNQFQLIDNLPTLITLISKATKIESENLNEMSECVINWLHVAMLVLSQRDKNQKSTKATTKVSDIINKAVKSTLNFMGDKSQALKDKKDNLQAVIQIITGLINLAQGDWAGIEPLAIKIGGFPKNKIAQLKKIVLLIEQNKDGLNMNSVGSLVAANTEAILDALPIEIPGGDKISKLIQQGLEDPSSLFDPKTLFNFFANSKGKMGFDEFSNIFKQLGLKIPHARMLQMFSLADREKKGELSFQDFVKSLETLKTYLISEVMEQLGLSITDMAISFAFSIAILILMFAFIFVGIAAFAPTSSFSSVTNSLMPLGAGASVNKNSKEDEQKPEELKAAAADI